LVVSNLYQALAHPARRRILKLLGDGPMAAGEIAEHFDVSKPTLSGHFNVLKDAGLVQAERDGTTIRYRLNVSVLEEAAAAILELLGTGRADEGENRP
jgi:DNA-binding transcriptional ArsR family regulator